MEPELIRPEDLDDWLRRAYDEAEALGLEPKWHPDAKGFTCICGICREAGRPEHRGDVRPVPLSEVRRRLVPLPLTLNDTATGPAG